MSQAEPAAETEETEETEIVACRVPKDTFDEIENLRKSGPYTVPRSQVLQSGIERELDAMRSKIDVDDSETAE